VILSLLKVDDWIVVDVRFGMSLNLQVRPPGASVSFSAYAAHFPVTSMAQKKKGTGLLTDSLFSKNA
jgi:hypothetical protein